MDDLLHFVRHEVAMDGDDGTTIDRLDSFLAAYYSRAAEASTSSNPSSLDSSTIISQQNLDTPFKEYIWHQLAALPELKVAFLRKLEAPQSTVPDEANANGDNEVDDSIDGIKVDSGTPAPVASGNNVVIDELGQEIDQGTFNLKNKAKIKAARKDPGKRVRDARLTGEQYEFVEIAKDEIEQSSRDQLLEKYGDTLRIAADAETCYVALTGSHERYGKLTQLAYQVLQAIARGRENGKTVVDLGKEFDHDQKSLFHFVKGLVELNFIVKIKVLDARSQTSRCIHRHYLETSRHWATWMTKDPNMTEAKAEDDDEDSGKTTPLSIMTVAHLNSNEPLVRSRILNALRKAPDNLIPHIDLIFAIGFQSRPPKIHRRRLNRIVATMERQGLIEKVGLARAGARGLLSCVRLPERAAGQAADGMNVENYIEEEEIEERPNLLLTIPVERQAIDLLAAAGPQGLTIKELQTALGDVGVRIIETFLTRIEKSAEPPHLCDFRIQSVLETFGREKRLRYFTVAGYHQRCRLDGLGDLPDRKDFSHPEYAGGFSVIDPAGFYDLPEDFAKIADKMQTGSKPTKFVHARNASGTTASTKQGSSKKSSSNGIFKRGRPSKAMRIELFRAEHGEDAPLPPELEKMKARKKPRPKKEQTEPSEASESQAPETAAHPRKERPESEQNEPKKIGRPKKARPEGEDGDVLNEPKKIGRPRKQRAEGEEAESRPKKKSRKSKTTEDIAVPVEENQTAATIDVDASMQLDTTIDLTMDANTPQSTTRKADDSTDAAGETENAPNKIKGRPRKYPPGTTSKQRAVLLEQRRALGLEPPEGTKVKKNKKSKKAAAAADESAGDTLTLPEGQQSEPPTVENTDLPALPSGDTVTEPQIDSATMRNVLESGNVTVTVGQGEGDASAQRADALTDISEPVHTNTKDAVPVHEVAEEAQDDTNMDIDTMPSAGNSILDPIPTVETANADVTVGDLPDVKAEELDSPNAPMGVPLPEQAGVPVAARQESNVPEAELQAPARSLRSKTAAADKATEAPKKRRGRSSKLQLASVPAPEVPTTEPRELGTSARPEISHTADQQPVAESHTAQPQSLVAPPITQVHDPDAPVQLGSENHTISTNDLPNDSSAAPPYLPDPETAKEGQKRKGRSRKSAKNRHKSATPNEEPVKGKDCPMNAETTGADVQANQDVALTTGNDGSPVVNAPSPLAPNAENPADPVKDVELPVQLPAMPEPLPASAFAPGMAMLVPNVPLPSPSITTPAMAEVKPTRALERSNYSMHVHENEYLAVLQEAGGIAEEGMPMAKLWQEYMHKKNPSKPFPRPLDRRTTNSITNALERRGLVKRSVIQIQQSGGRLAQRPIMYLSDIGLDSHQLREFSKLIQERMEGLSAPKKWLQGRKTIDKGATMPRKRKRVKDTLTADEIPTNPRDFFTSNWRIVAQTYGWQWGFLARARTLHEYLCGSITDENDSTFIVSSDPRIRIFASPFVLLDTPLSTFMRMSAISDFNEELDNFLKDNDPQSIIIKDLPTSVSGLFGSGKSKAYSRLSQLFDVLLTLKVLVPLEQTETETAIVAYSGPAREPRYFTPRNSKSDTNYWMLTTQAPLYDLQEKEGENQTLLGQLPVRTVEEVQHFWTVLHDLTFGRTKPDGLPTATVKYPPVLGVSSSFIVSARTASRWRSQYLLLASQKTYLRKATEIYGRPSEVLKDESKLTKLAYDVCAPVEVIRSYFAKPQKVARPKWQKRRRASHRVRAASGSEDSASDVDGPKAPLSKSERVAEKTAERKRVLNEARRAKKAESAQALIARKAKAARSDKQKIWDGIVNGFRMQYGVEAMQAVQLDFLQSWFMAPGGPTASAMQQHLQQAISGPDVAPALPPQRAILAAKSSSTLGNLARPGKKMKEKPINLKKGRMHQDDILDDFNLASLPALPEIKSNGGHKTGVNGWTEDEDELLVDAYVILQARANDTEQTFTMDPALKEFWPTYRNKVLLDRLRRLALQPGEAAYMDSLQEAWSRLWHDGHVKNTLLQSALREVNGINLVLLLRLLRGRLNKQSIRFQAIMPKDAAAAAKVRLPTNPVTLSASYQVHCQHPVEDHHLAKTWLYLWSTVTTAVKSASHVYQPYCTPYEYRINSKDTQAKTRFDDFEARRRAFKEEKATINQKKDAHVFEERLREEGEMEWPALCEDGDMMAMMHLFSHDLLNFAIDTSVTRPGRPYTDYRTRRIEDDSFENLLNVSLKPSYENLSTPLFPAIEE